MARNNKVTRKWEVFPGRNKFYCNGLLMTAPNTTVFYLTVFLITGTSGLFFVFDCPFLAQRITPAIPIVGGILYIFVMIALFRTSFSDPGIIPRSSSDEAADIEKQIEMPNSLNSPTYRPPPRVKEIYVKGQVVKLKYCFTCKIFRPPRASHCSLCDNCVERFDHHCPWVGNCVGKRNYRFFYMFIISLAFLAVFIFSCAMTHIILLTKTNEPVVTVIKETPTSIVVVTVCFFSVWSVIGLAGFHTYLTSSDQTTNEDIKGSFSSKNGQPNINPYSQGNICLNCFHVLCGPISPSLIDRRGIVPDVENSQMELNLKYTAGQHAGPTVMQPLNKYSTSTSGTKNEINNAGVFRQRSYENLNSNNELFSGSNVQLVDNEISLPTTSANKIIAQGLQSKKIDKSSNLSSNNDISLTNLNQTNYARHENFYHNVPPFGEKTNQNNNLSGVGQTVQHISSKVHNGGITRESIKNNTSVHTYSSIDEKIKESIDIFLKNEPNCTYEEEDDDDNIDENVVDDVMIVSDHEEVSNNNQLSLPPSFSSNFVNNNNIDNITSTTSSSSIQTQIETSVNTLPGFLPVLSNIRSFTVSPVNNNVINENNNSTSNDLQIGSDLDGASSIDNNSQSCLMNPAANV